MTMALLQVLAWGCALLPAGAAPARRPPRNDDAAVLLQRGAVLGEDLDGEERQDSPVVTPSTDSFERMIAETLELAAEMQKGVGKGADESLATVQAVELQSLENGAAVKRRDLYEFGDEAGSSLFPVQAACNGVTLVAKHMENLTRTIATSANRSKEARVKFVEKSAAIKTMEDVASFSKQLRSYNSQIRGLWNLYIDDYRRLGGPVLTYYGTGPGKSVPGGPHDAEDNWGKEAIDYAENFWTSALDECETHLDELDHAADLESAKATLKQINVDLDARKDYVFEIYENETRDTKGRCAQTDAEILKGLRGVSKLSFLAPKRMFDAGLNIARMKCALELHIKTLGESYTGGIHEASTLRGIDFPKHDIDMHLPQLVSVANTDRPERSSSASWPSVVAAAAIAAGAILSF